MVSMPSISPAGLTGSRAREAIPNVLSYANLERILRGLLKEGVPVRTSARPRSS